MSITRRDMTLAGAVGAAWALLKWKGGSKSLLPSAHHPDYEDLRKHSPSPATGRWRFDETVTDNFMNTAQQHPVVQVLRRSVALTECDIGNGMEGQGSAVLLDNQGTLALTAHQVNGNADDDMVIGFLPHADDALHYDITHATRIATDPATDISYWRLNDPSVIRTFGLQPIHWGHIGNGEHHRGDGVVMMGFPATAHGELNATPHLIEEYVPDVIVRHTSDGKNLPRHVACKIDTTEPIGPGTSGGGVFDDKTGDFLGTVNFTGSQSTEFTPSDAIFNGYIRLVPDAAQRYRYTPMPQQHRECEIGLEHPRPGIDRRHFLFPQE